MLAVVCKQKLLHENKIIQYLQKYKYCNVDQSDFRKPLQNFANTIKNIYFLGLPIYFQSILVNVQKYTTLCRST